MKWRFAHPGHALKSQRPSRAWRRLETLEARNLLAADPVLFSLTPQVQTGDSVELVARVLPESATPLADHFGDILVDQEMVQLTSPLGGIFVDGKHYIYGSHNTQWELWEEDPLVIPQELVAAYQADETITLLDSLLVADGVTDRRWGSIYSAAVLPDGSLVFVGESEANWNPEDTSQYFYEPTYWYDPTSPQTVQFDSSTSGLGRINDISETGTIVGNEFDGLNSPYFGSVDDPQWERVPATNGVQRNLGLGILSVSRDGKFAIDADNATTDSQAILMYDEVLGFDYFNHSHFDPIDVSAGLSWILSAETDDAGNTYFAGQGYADDGAIHVAFWDQDGNLVGDYVVGNLLDPTSQFAGFSDFAVVDGQVIAAVNTSGDSMLVRMSDGDTVAVSDLVGTPVYFDGLLGGLYADEGKLGMLLLTVEDANDSDIHGLQGEFELFTTVIATTGFNANEYEFHFDYDGDGNTDEIVTEIGSAVENVTYDLPGIYMPTVTIYDSENNLVGTETLEVAVSPKWAVDIQLVQDDQTQDPGTVSSTTADAPEFTEWDNVNAEIWLTLNADVPTENFDLTFAMQASADWLTDPVWLSNLGENPMIVEVDGDMPYLLITVENIDLSTYVEGNRILIGTIIFPVTSSDAVGMPIGDGGAYFEPFNQDGFQLYQAKIGDGNQLLDRQRQISSSFLPMIYDSDDDGKVGLTDFANFISQFGQIVGIDDPEAYLYDYNQDGKVNLADFALFISEFGQKKDLGSQPVEPARTFSTPTLPPVEAEPLVVTASEIRLEGEPESSPVVPLELGFDSSLATSEESDSQPAEQSPLAEPTISAEPVLSSFDAQAIDAMLLEDEESEMLLGDWTAEEDGLEETDALLSAAEDLL